MRTDGDRFEPASPATVVVAIRYGSLPSCGSLSVGPKSTMGPNSQVNGWDGVGAVSGHSTPAGVGDVCRAAQGHAGKPLIPDRGRRIGGADHLLGRRNRTTGHHAAPARRAHTSPGCSAGPPWTPQVRQLPAVERTEP